PPLPRELRRSGMFWLMGFVLILVTFILLVLVKPTDRGLERLDTLVLQWLQAIRTPWLTRLARGLNSLASVNVNLALRWATILTLIFFRRWRHLFVFVGAILVVGWFGTALADFVARPRPYDVVII